MACVPVTELFESGQVSHMIETNLADSGADTLACRLGAVFLAAVAADPLLDPLAVGAQRYFDDSLGEDASHAKHPLSVPWPYRAYLRRSSWMFFGCAAAAQLNGAPPWDVTALACLGVVSVANWTVARRFTAIFYLDVATVGIIFLGCGVFKLCSC